MPNGGKLTLNAKKKESLVEITAADTGEGIPDEVKESFPALQYNKS